MNRVPTFQLLSDATYTVLKPSTIGGVKLDRGDLLPDDSPLRQYPQRLETMCRHRFLRPGLPESDQPAKATIKKAAKVDDLDGLTFAQLRARCKELKVNAFGNSEQLRMRLRANLG